MSVPTSLNDFLKSLPATSDANGKYVVLTDSNGVTSKKGYNSFVYTDLYGKENKDAVLELKEYIRKYIQTRKAGECTGVNRYEFATMAYLKLTSSVQINLQYYFAYVTKSYLTVDNAWGLFSFMLFPSNFEANRIYQVTYYCTSEPSNATIAVYESPMTKLT